MRYQISHITTYAYEARVSLSHHALCLTPRTTDQQTLMRSHVQLDPPAEVLSQHLDFFGNQMQVAFVQQPYEQMRINARSEVEVTPLLPPTPEATPRWEQVRDQAAQDVSENGVNTLQFVFDSPYVQAGRPAIDYAAKSFAAGRPILEAALELTARIYEDFDYDSTATDVSTPVDEAFKMKRGVCQDFAHVMIAGLRGLGLPARYVSGYVQTYGPDGEVSMVGGDASHAWVSFYCPGTGWIDLDPTNNKMVGEEHISLAWGRDFGDVSPIRGVTMGGGAHTLAVDVSVKPIG